MTMKQLATALMLAGLVALPPIATPPAVAQEKAANKSKPAKSGLRECRIKGQGGKLLTWKCKTEQPCCYNASTNQGVCGSPVIGCF